MRTGSPCGDCDHYQDALIRADLPEWWGARHARRMYTATTSTNATHADPKRRLRGPRPPAAPPPPPRPRAGVQRPSQLPAGARPAAGQSRAAGQRTPHHHGRPPPARHRRHHPTTPPSDRRPHTPQQHRPAPGRSRREAGLRLTAGIPCRPGGDTAMAEHQHRHRAWRASGHGPRPARPASAAQPAGGRPPWRAIQRQRACWAAKRQARLAELGFADVEEYLRVRRVGQGWSLRRMLAELQVGSVWLKDQMHRLDIP
jgi:hypothetical protein